ncbi:MAG: hypothetical protein ACE5LB_04525 [Acidiferrobacterales bacterium]
MKDEYWREFNRKGVEQVKDELPYMAPREKQLAAKTWLAERLAENEGMSWLEEDDDAW